MNIIHYIIILGGALIACWAGIATIILAQDWRTRRDWRLQDERADWQRKVEAMRRIHDAEIDVYHDLHGDA